MHKYLYSFLLLFVCTFSNAQNWKPFYKGDTVNYKFTNSVTVSNTIWIDSAKVVGTDSVFYLNGVFLNCDTCHHIPGYLNCDTCFALDNQPQFLQRKIIKKDNGKYLLNDTSNLEIHTYAKLNDSWMFDISRAITATVVNVSLQNVMGVNDSVKIIRLSNNDTIKLSKSFGFVQFPNLYGAGNYRLIGIENRNKGEKVPGFWDIFNFNVTDVFQYKGYYLQISVPTECDYVSKYYILSKTVLANKFIYDVRHVEKGVLHWTYPPYWQPYTIDEYTTLEFDNPLDPILKCNGYNHKEFISDQCNKNFYYPFELSVDSLNIITKKTGIPIFPDMRTINGSYISYQNIPNLFLNTTGWIFDGAMAVEYKEALGITMLSWGCFENNDWKYLQGYIKNGDTVGVITKDDILLNINILDFIKKDIVFVFPNPFSETATFEVFNKNNSFPCVLSVFDINGRLLRKEKILNNQYIFHKDQLEHGMYIYFINDASGNFIGKGKLIIQ